MNKPNASYSPPSREVAASIADVINVKGALTELLANEATLMDQMEIKKVGELQERKLKLTAMLERSMRYLTQHQDILLNITPEEKTQLKTASDSFNTVMKKNYDTLLVARAVNGTVVKCVTETMARKDTNPIYNAQGNTAYVYQSPVSITLNQTI